MRPAGRAGPGDFRRRAPGGERRRAGRRGRGGAPGGRRPRLGFSVEDIGLAGPRPAADDGRGVGAPGQARRCRARRAGAERGGGAVRVHLVGIAGAGVSALARVYLTRGDEVSGCDIRELPIVDELKAEGAAITTQGQAAEHVRGQDLVVYGGQTKPDHFELAAARAEGARVRSRAEALSELIAETPDSIAIAGTHGKTTTAFMVGHVFNLAGRDTTLYIGDHSTHSRYGRGGWIVAEVDESDGTLMLHHPRHALVTNADYDHANFFADVQAVRAHFAQWLGRLPED